LVVSGAGIQQYQTRQGELKLDCSAHRVWLNDFELQLTNIEYKILELLCTNLGKVLEYGRFRAANFPIYVYDI